MDQRHVFNNNEQLLTIVTSISIERIRASLLVDKEGLTRLDGKITAIATADSIQNTSIVLENRHIILLDEIVGINGVFRSDYSEC